MELLTARYVLPISSAPIQDGAVVLDGELIHEVGLASELRTKYPDAKVSEFPHHVLMPGLVDAHSCLELGALHPEDVPSRYIEWQTSALQMRQSQSAVKRREAIVSGLQYALAAGVTTIGDKSHYNAIWEAAAEVGCRLLISPELTGTQGLEQQALFEDSFKLIEAVEDANSDRLRVGLAPFAPYALSRHLLKIVSQHAQGGLLASMRVSVSFAEMEFFFESKGEIADIFFPAMGWKEELPLAQRKTPIQFLESIGFFDCKPTLIGCTHLSDGDLEIIQSSGSAVVHTPLTNQRYDLGRAPLKKLRDRDVTIGIGSGSSAAPMKQSMWDALRSMYEIETSLNSGLSAADLITMATLGSAKALHWDDEIGSLAAKKRADIIAVSVPEATSLSELSEVLIQNTTTEQIEKVYVNGSWLQ